MSLTTSRSTFPLVQVLSARGSSWGALPEEQDRFRSGGSEFALGRWAGYGKNARVWCSCKRGGGRR